MTDDDHVARQRRVAERRELQEQEVRGRAKYAAMARKEQWLGLLRACAPSGWAFDSTTAMKTGLIALGAIYGAIVLAVMIVPSLSFGRVFDALGPFAAGWLSIVPLAVAFTVPSLIRRLAMPAALRAVDQEHAWLAALPLPMPELWNLTETYAHGMHWSGGGSLRVTLYFVAKDVPTERLDELLRAGAMSYVLTAHTGELRIQLSLAGRSDTQVARNRRLLLHDLATGVLVPVHADAPLERIEIEALS